MDLKYPNSDRLARVARWLASPEAMEHFADFFGPNVDLVPVPGHAPVGPSVFDFAYAARAFRDAGRIEDQDQRGDYGEDRYRLLGVIGNRVFVLIYTMRGSAIRIISARKANRKEVQEYEHDAREG
jgi:hypothetical protein